MPTDSADVPPAVTLVEVETSPNTEQTEAQQPEARAEASCSADTSSASGPNLARYIKKETAPLVTYSKIMALY